MDHNKEFTEAYDDTLEIDCQGKSERILHMMHGLVQLAANQGFYLHCWEKVFNIMIYKKNRLYRTRETKDSSLL